MSFQRTGEQSESGWWKTGQASSTGGAARPHSAIDQVLVRISASGVNPLDIKIRQGSALHAKQPLPAVLGLDMAGTVEEVGRSVTAFNPGDVVPYGMVGVSAAYRAHLPISSPSMPTCSRANRRTFLCVRLPPCH